MDVLNILSTIGLFILNQAPLLVGFIIPPFVELLNKEVDNERERFIVTLLACMAAGAVLHWSEIKVGSVDQAIQSISIIFIESQVVFKLYFKSSYFRQKLTESKKVVIPERVQN